MSRVLFIILNNSLLIQFGVINMGGSYIADITVNFPISYNNYYIVTTGDINSGGGSNSSIYDNTSKSYFRIGITSYHTSGYVNWTYWISMGY